MPAGPPQRDDPSMGITTEEKRDEVLEMTPVTAKRAMSQGPFPRPTAWRAIARCFMTSMLMLARGELGWPRDSVDEVVRFADGTSARVYRETVVPRVPRDPCFLAVSFRLRGV